MQKTIGKKMNDLYFEPHTGSTDTWENWERDSFEWVNENGDFLEEEERLRQLNSLCKLDQE